MDEKIITSMPIDYEHGSSAEEWRYLDLTSRDREIYISRFEEAGKDGEANASPSEMPAHYATLKHNGSDWLLEDTCTKFGVYVNQKKLTAPCVLREGDQITIGKTLFQFGKDRLQYSHREYTFNKLSIHIEERSVWQLFRKHILLQDINLTIFPGEMVLILGGSGAGKTTFVNAVTGYEKARATITEGSRDVYHDYNEMKYEIGFVPQQDLLRDQDTVYSTLVNAAEMRLPTTAAKEEREEQITMVLELFGLDAEKNSLVEKLSGGQRKRLSIGVEFIANPTLFFLDEPDSGLDGVMARSLMKELRAIADKQKIILVITHTPDRVIDLFDKVIVLAKSEETNIGHMAFYGSPKEARDFFGKDTMEDILLVINRKDEGGEGRADEFIKKYAQIQEAHHE